MPVCRPHLASRPAAAPPQDAEERQSEALEIALLNRSHKHRSGEDPETGAPRGCGLGRPAACAAWLFALPVWLPGLPLARPDHTALPAPAPNVLLAHVSSCSCPVLPPPACPAAAVPAGRSLDAAEHLLVKCRPLEPQWGTERFGLADPSVLQAIEVWAHVAARRVCRGVLRAGRAAALPCCAALTWLHRRCAPCPPLQGLPGAESVAHYRFVDERVGGWVAVARQLNQQLAAHGKKQVGVWAREVGFQRSGLGWGWRLGLGSRRPCQRMVSRCTTVPPTPPRCRWTCGG